MGDNSGIRFCDATWNVLTGCMQVSEGCRSCYAMRMAATRLKDHSNYRGLTTPGGFWTGKYNYNAGMLGQPARWSKPRIIFVCSMADLFYERIPFLLIHNIWREMANAAHHRFLVLTKRVDRMKEFIDYWQSCENPIPYNIHIGATVENEVEAGRRIQTLSGIPAAGRFLSMEPLLEPVSLRAHGVDPSKIGWVIVGGESGLNCRDMQVGWARDIRKECLGLGISFFMKQMSGYRPRNVPIPEDLNIQEWPEGLADVATANTKKR